MDYQFRTPTAADWDEVSRVLWDAFNNSTYDEAEIAAEGATWEPDRAVVAETGGSIAGHAASYTRDMIVPGGRIPAAHVTMVSVAPTHRRQRLLTRMIDRLHQDAIDHHEPIAVLWASEGRIYQRFGYGLAAHHVNMTGRSSEIVWLDAAPSLGRLRAVPATDPEPFIPIYEAVLATKPGWSSRDARWWTYRLADMLGWRKDATPQRAVLHEDAGGNADGYLIWRVKSDWDPTGPNGKVQMIELVAANPAAYRALWQFALNQDLSRHVEFWHGTADEPIQYMIGDPRRLGPELHDSLWVRIIDVPAALEGRRYSVPVDVVLDVVDQRIPANNGRWHLVGSPEKASCEATDEPADLLVDIRALGAAYLGGPSLRALAAAGRVTEARPGTLEPTAAAFRGTVEPSTTDGF